MNNKDLQFYLDIEAEGKNALRYFFDAIKNNDSKNIYFWFLWFYNEIFKRWNSK